MEVTQVLLNAQSVDGTVRKQAEDSLKQFQEQNLPAFLLSISEELANEEKPVDSRKLAGLVLKNTLDAKEQSTKFELVQRWLSLDMNAKIQIRRYLLQTLSSPVHDARSTASQVIAKIAGIELPHKQWPELIGSLLSNTHQLPAHVKQATLETLGYLCEEVSSDVVDQDQVNKILTAVVQGMSSSESNDVRLAATRALYNALGFAQANFTNDMERDYIMRVVCEATLSPELKIRQAAFECLVSISSTYYEKLAPYIQDIFNITAKAVREDEEPVALQAIEFWSSICDEEIDILEEYAGDFSGDSDIPCFYFIKQALPALVPMLLETLLKQEEDQDLDEGAWNLAMAGGTCLGLVAQTVGDDIVPLVLPFIQENISKPDWRQREAATYAFGSILEGPSPDKLTSIVNVALDFMLSALMKDPNNHVKDTTAWTLGRIFEFLHGSTLESSIITPANCQQIVTVLLQSMKDAPNVAEKACGALYFLAQGYETMSSSSSLLSPFFQEIVQAILTVTHREDAGDSRLRTAAYEALNEVVRSSREDTAPMVMQLVPLIMMELHNTLEMQKPSSDEKEKQAELQGLLCGCLQVFIQRLGGSEATKYAFMQYADQMMGLFLRVFECRSATVHEEAMLAIGALAYATGAEFAKYMAEFYKFLEKGLQNFEEYQVCAITVGVVGDICRALELKILPYCDGIMTQLLKDLSSNQLHRSVKPPIFSCFGDIALAIGENFDKYLMYAMPMLQGAAELSAHTPGFDDEMTEYTNLLRNGILEAYSGIFQGFKSSPKTQLLMPYATHILQFLDSLYQEKDMDDVVTKTAIGLLGDVADTLGSNAGSLIQLSVSSREFLNDCLSSDDHLIKESAEWARMAITQAVTQAVSG